MDDLIIKLGKHSLTMELDYQQAPAAPVPGVPTPMEVPPPGVVVPQQPMMGHYQQQQQQPQPQQSVLGLIIPGRPVLTNFVPADGSGTKFALTLSSPGDYLPSPLTLVNEIVAYLQAPLPQEFGLSIYWQLSCGQQQSGFELLGSLTDDKPSDIFRTGWSEHDQMVSIPPNTPATITFGISIEPIDTIRNIQQQSSSTSSSSLPTNTMNNNNRRPYVAQKIAQDLYNFMQSFDTGGGGGGGVTTRGQMIVPTNIFDRWWKRFESKSKRDPNFFLKSGD